MKHWMGNSFFCRTLVQPKNSAREHARLAQLRAISVMIDDIKLAQKMQSRPVCSSLVISYVKMS